MVFVFLSQSSLTLNGFCDADWAGCSLTRQNTTWYCILICANCIFWSSKKQPIITRSSVEAEYRALASIVAELTWIGYLLHDIGLSISSTPQLFSDNLSALHMTINPVFLTHEQNILNLIITMFVRKWLMGTLLLNLFPKLQILDVFSKLL